MNIFEKIKQIYRNFSKKQKLIEAPKEKVEEIDGVENIGGNTTTVESLEKTTFRDELRFDPEDLLDPRVCQGDDVIPNILKTLGVNETILNNAIMMGELRQHCGKILSQHGIVDFKFGIGQYNKYKEFTREQIDAMVRIIKSRGALSDAEISDRYTKISYEEYAGLEITSSGEVILTSFDMSQYPDGKYASNHRTVLRCLDDGKTQMEQSTRVANPQTEGLVLQSEIENKYNESGLEMSSEIRGYYSDGQINSHKIATRDSEYPFVVNAKTLVENGVDVKQEETFPMRNLANGTVSHSNLGRMTREGYKQVTFEDREQIAEFYEQNKQEIAQEFMKEPSGDYMGTKQKQTLMNGMRKLAQKAGILPKEQETEKSE